MLRSFEVDSEFIMEQNMYDLNYLSNMENINAVLIEDGLSQKE